MAHEGAEKLFDTFSCVWTCVASDSCSALLIFETRNLLLHAIFGNFSLLSHSLSSCWQWFIHHLYPRLIFLFFSIIASLSHPHPKREEVEGATKDKYQQANIKIKRVVVWPFSLDLSSFVRPQNVSLLHFLDIFHIFFRLRTSSTLVESVSYHCLEKEEEWGIGGNSSTFNDDKFAWIFFF